MTNPTNRALQRPVKIVDKGSYSSFNSTFGETIQSPRYSRIVEEFQYNINTLTLTETETNNGTVTQGDSMAILTSSTTSNGSARLESKRKLRYRPGHEGYAFFTALWANGGVANATQYAGLFDSTDGFFIGYNGTNFVVGRRKDSSDTTVTQANFNGDHSFNSIVTSNLNIFMITYGWLGTAPVNFWWMNERGEWILIHRMELPNTLTGPSVTNPVLPMAFDITKTSGSESIVMKTASWHAGIIEPVEAESVGDRYFSADSSGSTISTETVLLNVRNQTTFQSKTNKVEIDIEFFEASSEGTKPAIIEIYKNLAIGGTPVWGDVDATNSVVQTDTAGTVTPDTTKRLFSIHLAKSDSHSVQGLPSFYLLPGETLTVTGQSATNTDLNFYMLWREEF